MSKELPPCNRDVYENGESICWLADWPKESIEEWCKTIARESGQRVDWHYAGGRAHVLALGNLHAVRGAIMMFKPGARLFAWAHEL